jgi:8-oxo-dGTP pyrophosphatase MutT (NUDIX family)
MRIEKSFGIVPLKRHNNIWKVFLVQHSKALFWGYPKGHAEGEETPLASATRELKEETALEIKRLLRDVPFEEHYCFTMKGEKVFKTVQLFAAEVCGSVQLQATEILAGKWLPLSEAATVLTYPTDRHALLEVINFLKIYR